jgi:hypothetical protein
MAARKHHAKKTAKKAHRKTSAKGLTTVKKLVTNLGKRVTKLENTVHKHK